MLIQAVSTVSLLLVCGVVACAAAASTYAALMTRRRRLAGRVEARFAERRRRRESADAAERDQRQQLRDASTDAEQAFDDARTAFSGPVARLRRLAEAADALAAVVRVGAGRKLGPPPAALSGDPPLELHRSYPRVPAVEEWQAFDRAHDALAAMRADEESTYDRATAALTAYARAARAVADATERYRETDPREVEIEQLSALSTCSMCGESGDRAGVFVAGYTAVICQRCVASATELLDDRLGPGWRDVE